MAVGEVLGAGAQDVPDPVQRVVLAAPVAVDLCCTGAGRRRRPSSRASRRGRRPGPSGRPGAGRRSRSWYPWNGSRWRPRPACGTPRRGPSTRSCTCRRFGRAAGRAAAPDDQFACGVGVQRQVDDPGQLLRSARQPRPAWSDVVPVGSARARCPDCSGSVSRAARRTRRAILTAPGSPRVVVVQPVVAVGVHGVGIW